MYEEIDSVFAHYGEPKLSIDNQITMSCKKCGEVVCGVHATYDFKDVPDEAKEVMLQAVMSLGRMNLVGIASHKICPNPHKICPNPPKVEKKSEKKWWEFWK